MMVGEVRVEVRATFWSAPHKRPISKSAPVVIRHGQGPGLATSSQVFSSAASVLESMLQGEVDGAWSDGPLASLKVHVWNELHGEPNRVVVMLSLVNDLLPFESSRAHDYVIADPDVLAAMEELGGTDAVLFGVASMVESVGEDDAFAAAVGLAVASREDKDKREGRVVLGSGFGFGPLNVPRPVDCGCITEAEFIADTMNSLECVALDIDPARPDTVVVEVDGKSHEVRGLAQVDADALAGEGD